MKTKRKGLSQREKKLKPINKKNGKRKKLTMNLNESKIKHIIY